MPALVVPSTDERTLLLDFLDQQRQAVIAAAYGLGDSDAVAMPTAGELSIGGLIKHLAAMERNWLRMVQGTHETGDAEAYVDGFRLGPGEALAAIVEDYRACGEETREAIAAVDDLNQPVPVPKGVPWFPDDVDAWSVRWVLLHLIEEAARHAGHADIVRESIDAATAYPLLAAIEGWPATPWLQPWEPASGQLATGQPASGHAVDLAPGRAS